MANRAKIVFLGATRMSFGLRMLRDILPDQIAKLLSVQVNVRQLAVEAAIRASKEIALQALLVDPVVNSASAAVNPLDELWEVNRPIFGHASKAIPSIV
jgi:alpha-galactosidase/6-phospho-beta-glucosidase family protein